MTTTDYYPPREIRDTSKLRDCLRCPATHATDGDCNCLYKSNTAPASTPETGRFVASGASAPGQSLPVTPEEDEAWNRMGALE